MNLTWRISTIEIKSLHLEESKLEVARFRECVSVGCQNQAGFGINLLAEWESHHLLLIMLWILASAPT